MKAIMFDFSGTLFRLDEEDSWFEGMPGVDDAVSVRMSRRRSVSSGDFVTTRMPGARSVWHAAWRR